MEYLCFTPGNIFDLIVLVLGIVAVIRISIVANEKGVLGEKYFIALIFFVAFIMWGLVDYDPKLETCKHPNHQPMKNEDKEGKSNSSYNDR